MTDSQKYRYSVDLSFTLTGRSSEYAIAETEEEATQQALAELYAKFNGLGRYMQIKDSQVTVESRRGYPVDENGNIITTNERDDDA